MNTDTYELEEGEWIPEDYHEYDVTNSTENVADEGIAAALKLIIDQWISISLLVMIMSFTVLFLFNETCFCTLIMITCIFQEYNCKQFVDTYLLQ